MAGELGKYVMIEPNGRENFKKRAMSNGKKCRVRPLFIQEQGIAATTWRF